MLTWFRAVVGDSSDNLDGAPRINKKYLATLLTWLDDNVPLSVAKWKSELLSGDWSPKERESLREHLESGKFDANFQLMTLRSLDDKAVQEGTRGGNMDADYDENLVVETLNEWEIKSLRLCKPLQDRLTDELKGEEF